MKNRVAQNEFSQYASDAPHVDGLVTRGEPKKYLRRSIPSGGDILCDDVLLVFVIEGFGLFDSTEAKITDFNITVGIDKNIGGFDVSVDEFTFVKVGDGMKNLIGDVFPLNCL